MCTQYPLPAPVPPTSSTDLPPLLQQVLVLLRGMGIQPTTTPTTPPDPAQQLDQLRKLVEIISGIITPGAKLDTQPLGQVNGALGQTIGNLFDGKKTAIGILGALLTAWLSSVPSVPAASGLEGVLSGIANSVPGLSGFTMPLFLALSAWGVLGKLEKWAQGTVPPVASKI